MIPDPQAFLASLWDAALAVARPSAASFAPLPAPPRGRTLVLGGGKAAGAMAAAFEEALGAARWPSPVSGLVVTRYGHTAPTTRIEVREAAHPKPDRAGVRAAEDVLGLAHGAGPDDLVVFLISGGASALLSAPDPSVSWEQKRDLVAQLMDAGAPIDALNRVRTALSAIKGGRLALKARRAGAAITYAISDVPGDAPAVIASGPTVAPRKGGESAAEILRRYGVRDCWAEAEKLDAVGPGGSLDVTVLSEGLPDAEIDAFAYPPFRLIATPQMALEAAAEVARAAGVAPMILGDSLEGDAAEAATVMAGIAGQIATRGQPLAPPCVLLSGGEFTTAPGAASGIGGPNTTFALSLALALATTPAAARAWALSGDTDGKDGSGEAGARISPGVIERAAAAGLDPRGALANSDAHGFFAALGDALVTGPTLTNVNDFRAIYIAPA